MHNHKGWNGIKAYENTHYILAIDMTRIVYYHAWILSNLICQLISAMLVKNCPRMGFS